MTRPGADAIVASLDRPWQKIRESIEEYGREMYNAGAQRLLERLGQEAAGPCLCPVCAVPESYFRLRNRLPGSL